MEARPEDLRATSRELPRLKGKSWWLTKQVQTFAVEEMRDVEFEPAVPISASELRTAVGYGPAHCLAQFGTRVLPIVMAGAQSTDRSDRRLAVSIMADRQEARFGSRPINSSLGAPLLKLLGDDDAWVRQKACEAVAVNWDPLFAPSLTELLRDSDEDVRSSALNCLNSHQTDLETQLPALRKMVEEDGPAASKAMNLLTTRQDAGLTREQLVRLLSSTNLPVVLMALARLRENNLSPGELAPLLTSSLPHARLAALGALRRMGDKVAVEYMISCLRDPNEAIRWMVRSNPRRLTGQKLGADPAVWEKWWADNKETFTPPLAGSQRSERN
jgi:hypothetical protein